MPLWLQGLIAAFKGLLAFRADQQDKEQQKEGRYQAGDRRPQGKLRRSATHHPGAGQRADNRR